MILVGHMDSVEVKHGRRFDPIGHSLTGRSVFSCCILASILTAVSAVEIVPTTITLDNNAVFSTSPVVRLAHVPFGKDKV